MTTALKTFSGQRAAGHVQSHTQCHVVRAVCRTSTSHHLMLFAQMGFNTVEKQACMAGRSHLEWIFLLWVITLPAYLTKNDDLLTGFGGISILLSLKTKNQAIMFDVQVVSSAEIHTGILQSFFHHTGFRCTCRYVYLVSECAFRLKIRITCLISKGRLIPAGMQIWQTFRLVSHQQMASMARGKAICNFIHCER